MLDRAPEGKSVNRVRKLEISRSRERQYLLLLVTETIGVALILWDGVPLYRQVVRQISSHRPEPGIVWWAVTAVILLQVSYWLRMRLQLPVPWSGHPFIAHAILFVGRISFVFATSVASFVFLNNFEKLNLPPHRTVMLLALLFSMFCWTLELDRLGKGLAAKPEPRTGTLDSKPRGGARAGSGRPS